MKTNVVGRSRVLPVLLRHDHLLEVETDHEGRFVGIRELMPPLVNHERLRAVDEAGEKALREREWRALEANGYAAHGYQRTGDESV